jgi:hypothetical protein
MANGLTAGVHRATTWSLVVSVLMIVSGVCDRSPMVVSR